jgi:myxalamid-type polyketide synthase MxaE and MxaD
MRADEHVVDWLAAYVAETVGIDAADVARDALFVELGLSSMQAIELSDDLGRRVDLDLPATLAFDYPTIAAAAEFVAEETARIARMPTAAAGRGRDL